MNGILQAGAALIFCATGLGMLAPANAAPPAADGQKVFRQRCQSCHSDTAGQPARVGPNLAGVVGRKAASSQFNYTPALKGSKLTWTRENLDKFLSGPVKMLPGTRMVVALSDPAQRAAVIDYLARKR